MAKTVEDLLAQLQSVLDENKTNPAVADDAPLTEDQAARYEAIEKELAGVRKTDEIQKRNAAYRAVSTPAIQTASNTQQDDTLERAFDHYMRTGRENQDIVELRAQSEGTTTAGGYMVPHGFREKLVERMKAFGGIASACEEIVTTTGGPLEWPTVDDTANVGEIVAENGTFAAGADLVFGTATMGAYKYMAGGGTALPLRVSVELLQDAAFDVQSLVARKLGERIARLQATHLASGTGSGQPTGLIYGLTGIQPAANTGVLTYADLLKFVHSVDPAYRENAKWVFNDNTLATLQGIVDSTGRPLLNSQNDAITKETGGGASLLGYPVVVDQSFSNITAGSATVNWGAFGDFQEGYVIRRVRDIQLMVNPYSRMAYGQIEFSVWARMDARPQNPFAYVALTDKV